MRCPIPSKTNLRGGSVDICWAEHPYSLSLQVGESRRERCITVAKFRIEIDDMWIGLSSFPFDAIDPLPICLR